MFNKKLITVVFIFVLLIVSVVCIKFVSLGTKEVTMGASLINLEVPKLSSLESECCQYSATFKTIRGKNVIKKELNNIIDSYDKILCDNRVYYYSKDLDITISEYGVESGTIFNKFYINYNKGKTCN